MQLVVKLVVQQLDESVVQQLVELVTKLVVRQSVELMEQQLAVLLEVTLGPPVRLAALVEGVQWVVAASSGNFADLIRYPSYTSLVL